MRTSEDAQQCLANEGRAATDGSAEERNYLHALLEAASDALALFDLEGRLLLANLAFGKLFGLTPDGLAREDPARTIEFLTSPSKDPVEFEQRFRTLLFRPETTERDTIELALPCPRTMLRVRTPLRDTLGRVIGHVHSLRDVTKEQQEARMRKELVSTLSHDLRTPLTSIKGSLQLMIESAQNLPPSDKELLDICLRNTDRLISLINDILGSSKTDAGELGGPIAAGVTRSDVVPLSV